jgi:serine/threonine protein kinase
MDNHLRIVCKLIIYPLLVAITPFCAIYVNDLYIFHSNPTLAPPLSEEKWAASFPMRTYHSTHPIVYSIESETGRKFVVKQTRDLSLKTKIASKFLIAHEYAILQAIQDVPHVTHLIGKINKHAFCMNYIPSIGKPELTIEQARVLKMQLTSIINNLHEKNVCFLDLCTSNILFSPDLTPNIIDFGSSIKLTPILKKIIGPYLYHKDYIHLLKLTLRLAPQGLSEDELKQLLTYYKGKYFRKKLDPFIKEIQQHMKRDSSNF